MKEKYFTYENIAGKAKEIKMEAQNSFNHPKLEFTGEHCALLVMDMQNFFSETTSHAFIPSFEAIVPNVQRVINSFKKKNLPVIITKHVNTPENACMMSEWWRDILTEEDRYSGIAKEIDISNSVIVEKSQYDAFYNTDLEKILCGLKVNNLVITGVMTHLCCETTARAAFVRGFKTFFVIDATATYNEKFHRNTVMNLAHGFSVPVLAQEISGKLNA